MLLPDAPKEVVFAAEHVFRVASDWARTYTLKETQSKLDVAIAALKRIKKWKMDASTDAGMEFVTDTLKQPGEE